MRSRETRRSQSSFVRIAAEASVRGQQCVFARKASIGLPLPFRRARPAERPTGPGARNAQWARGSASGCSSGGAARPGSRSSSGVWRSAAAVSGSPRGIRSDSSLAEIRWRSRLAAASPGAMACRCPPRESRGSLCRDAVPFLLHAPWQA